MPTFIRAWERTILWVHGKLLLTAFAAQKTNLTFHKDDAEYDLIKFKKGLSTVNPRKHIRSREANLLLSNETCVIQFIYLATTYAPIFSTMDFDEESGRAGVRAIGMFEIIGRACGLRFPQKCPSNYLYRSFKELR